MEMGGKILENLQSFLPPPPSYNHLTEITESRGCRQNLSGQLRGFWQLRGKDVCTENL